MKVPFFYGHNSSFVKGELCKDSLQQDPINFEEQYYYTLNYLEQSPGAVIPSPINP